MNKGLIMGLVALTVVGGAGYYFYSENEKKKKTTTATKPAPTFTTLKEGDIKQNDVAVVEDLRDGKIDDTKSYVSYVTGAPQLSLEAEQYLKDQEFLNNKNNFVANPNIDVIANLKKRNEIQNTDYSAQKTEIANQQAIAQSRFTEAGINDYSVQLNNYFALNPMQFESNVFTNPTLQATILVDKNGLKAGTTVSGQWKTPDCFEVQSANVLVCFKPSEIKIIRNTTNLSGFGILNQLGRLM